jgi:hypothetical protein
MDTQFPIILGFDLGSGALEVIDNAQEFDNSGAFSANLNIFLFFAVPLAEIIKIGSNAKILTLESIPLIGDLRKLNLQ